MSVIEYLNIDGRRGGGSEGLGVSGGAGCLGWSTNGRFQSVTRRGWRRYDGFWLEVFDCSTWNTELLGNIVSIVWVNVENG